MLARKFNGRFQCPSAGAVGLHLNLHGPHAAKEGGGGQGAVATQQKYALSDGAEIYICRLRYQRAHQWSTNRA